MFGSPLFSPSSGPFGAGGLPNGTSRGEPSLLSPSCRHHADRNIFDKMTWDITGVYVIPLRSGRQAATALLTCQVCSSSELRCRRAPAWNGNGGYGSGAALSSDHDDNFRDSVVTIIDNVSRVPWSRGPSTTCQRVRARRSARHPPAPSVFSDARPGPAAACAARAPGGRGLPRQARPGYLGSQLRARVCYGKAASVRYPKTIGRAVEPRLGPP